MTFAQLTKQPHKLGGDGHNVMKTIYAWSTKSQKGAIEREQNSLDYYQFKETYIWYLLR